MARRPTPRPVAAPQPSPREILFGTWFGRLFLVAVGTKFAVALWRAIAAVPPDALPTIVRVVSGTATIALAIALGMFAWRLFVQIKRRLLWRVRRKLILSYIFIGVIPSLLILVFFLFAGSLLFMNVSAYLFKDGYDAIVENARISAQAAATEIARNPDSALETIQRVHRIRASTYRGISVVYLAPDGRRVTAGPWQRLPPPTSLPVWLREDAFAGSIGLPVRGSDGEEDLVVRAVMKVGPGGTGGAVIVDIPVDDQVMHRLHEGSGVRLEGVYGPTVSESDKRVNKTPGQGGTLLFERSLTQLDVNYWEPVLTVKPLVLLTRPLVRRDTAALSYRPYELYKHLSSAQSLLVQGDMRLADALLVVLLLIGVMFLIIEAVALVMGLALARSITSSVHELFMGTERVQAGDFAHRINIESRDQLGELADSFNSMTGSIENLLQTAAEKKRLEEELRIARQIQMSLLPRGPLDVPGLGVTALCVPAREVGGDYYDFFHVGERRMGVLIADVSGKGTSAALYMAELKGLMLSLSQIYQSPRQLLIEVNRIISENLDSRSFITMMYAVIDFEAGVMTFARAGHTPLMFVRSGRGDVAAQVLAPNGLVVGLRIPGAHEKFIALLEEDRIELQKGDVLVFYTDGITEAMNQDSDLFGDARLSRLLAEHGHLDAADLRERILREIEAFVGVADQHDDMTMILIKVEDAFAAAEKVAV